MNAEPMNPHPPVTRIFFVVRVGKKEGRESERDESEDVRDKVHAMSAGEAGGIEECGREAGKEEDNSGEVDIILEMRSKDLN